ncbi:MAG: four helix bundle protein [Chloroflexi bacterium]|nr:four helix bundle protein [Chloroflexota bacterium]
MSVEMFTDLQVWQEAHQLVLRVYEITRKFPSDERFGLVSQIRRAALSIPANIAEGFKRRGLQDKIRFYNTAEGSLEELKYFFIVSKDLGYINSTTDKLTRADMVGRLLNGLIASTERRKHAP